MGIPQNGYQMEKRLEPWNLNEGTKRSGKYDRYFNYEASPYPETIKLISMEASYSQKVFYSPLWESLKATKQTPSEWLSFFSSLSPQLQAMIFAPKNNFERNELKTHLRIRTIDSIVRMGNLEALACLIALYRYSALPNVYIITGDLKFYINQLLCSNITQEPLRCVQNEIIQFICSHANYLLSAPNDLHLFQEVLQKKIRITELWYKLFFRIRILDSNKRINECHYWLSQIDERALLVDLVLLNSGASLIPSAKYGLLDFIEKLNFTRNINFKLGLGPFIFPLDQQAPELIQELHATYDELEEMQYSS